MVTLDGEWLANNFVLAVALCTALSAAIGYLIRRQLIRRLASAKSDEDRSRLMRAFSGWMLIAVAFSLLMASSR